MRGEPPSGSAKRDYIAAFCPSELSHKFSSKQDLLTYMSDHRKLKPFLFMFDFIVQYYVPPPSSCNRDFLRQVLKSSMARRNFWRWANASLSTCLSSTSLVQATSSPSSFWIRRSCSICRTPIREIGSPIEHTSTQFSTQSIQTMSRS